MAGQSDGLRAAAKPWPRSAAVRVMRTVQAGGWGLGAGARLGRGGDARGEPGRGLTLPQGRQSGREGAPSLARGWCGSEYQQRGVHGVRVLLAVVVPQGDGAGSKVEQDASDKPDSMDALARLDAVGRCGLVVDGFGHGCGLRVCRLGVRLPRRVVGAAQKASTK